MKKRNYRDNLIVQKSYAFSLKIIQLFLKLKGLKLEILATQLLRSGTSIGANIAEATAANSKKDFIYKMNISSKEARESHYWLSLLKDSKLLSSEYDHLIDDCEELIKILTAILKTSKANN
ncbi:MAG: four helix bundle protein [Bacteroidetes bacterium]|nr:four helix bundle protein [Bacteroidota bacterium]